MSYLDKLRKQHEIVLVANPVAVPELAHLFEKGEPTLFYVTTLSAAEKDKFDVAFVDYCKRYEVKPEDEREIYRSFAVAYCLCDSSNTRIAKGVAELDESVELIASLNNRVVSRLWVVANGANRFFGVDDELKKSLEAQEQLAKKDAGNGASLSTSGFHHDPLG